MIGVGNLVMKLSKYLLEITVFICGAVVMIFELIGSRILGPYFGTSIFVWTSLIGVILGSLSLGYYIGGKIADKKCNYDSLGVIILLSAVLIGLTAIAKNPLLIFLEFNVANLKIESILASLILFSPTSILLGIVSPYAAKLKIDNLATSGSTVGNLYALSTAGSIVGTFLSGFYLIPHFGTNNLLILLASSLLIISCVLSAKKFIKIKLATVGTLLLVWLLFGISKYLYQKNGFFDIDTAYNRIWISERKDKASNQMIRTLSINNENSSAMFLTSNELVYEYTKYYDLAEHFNLDFKKALMFGGAGYSYPKKYLDTYPENTIDVVEIDPTVTKLAKRYFNLKDNSRLHVYHEDGRVYLNTTTEKYDVIFGDAFNSHYSIPYQLTTKEAVQKNFDILNENGVVILNIISSIEGTAGKFLRAEYATYKSIFPQVYVFPIQDPQNGKAVQSIILIAIKSNKLPTFNDQNPQLNQYLDHLWKKEIYTDIPILTDNFAPVDYYISQMIF